MKNIKSVLVSLVLLFGVFGATAAQAYPGHFYGPRVGVGLYVDPWAAFYPLAYAPYGYYGGYYGYAPYGYAPVSVTQPAAPTVYVEQGQQPAQQTVAPAQSNDWYYCRKPEGYYPYVRNCTEAWQRVPAQPPSQH